MKYIRHRKFGFVLFEPSFGHAEVAQSLGEPSDVLSAGFVFTPGVDLRCVGHSSSLNLATAPHDATDLQSRLLGY